MAFNLTNAVSGQQQQHQQQTQNLERGSDCLIRDAQRIVTLSATEKFDGVDGVISTLLPFHVYGRQSQLDNDYSFAMNLLASEGLPRTQGGASPKIPGSQQKAMRRIMSSRTDVFEAQMVRKAGVVRKRLERLQQRIDGLEMRGNHAAMCELMLHVSDGASREFAAREAKEREEKRKREEKMAEEKRLQAEREERLRAERARWQAEQVAAAAAAMAGARATSGGEGVAQGQQAVPLKPSGSLKLKLSMKKEHVGAPPQPLRAGSGANFLTSPMGQTSLSMASHNPQMSGDASRMSPGITDGGTLVDSRAMSVEIEAGSKRGEYDDVVSSGQMREADDAQRLNHGVHVGGPSAPPAPVNQATQMAPVAQGVGSAPGGQGQGQVGAQDAKPALPKPQMSGKFKLMKLMKKKK